MPLAKIGFFLHAPFPASDVWRTVAVRLELLRSLLNVDLVGFLLSEYARNVLTCCKRMLGLEYEFQKGGFLGVEYEGRHVHVQICTFGISPKQVDRWLKAPEFVVTPNAADVALFDVCSRPHRMPGHVLLGGLDYLDRLKGVAAKLLAWEALLRDYPHYRQGYTLVQVCVGARNRIALNTAPAVEAELRGIVARINATFPGSVHFEVRSHLTPIERLRLWCACSVLLVTALREAINVFPLEYVLARQLSMQPPGVLVLSEFTGFARVLNGCLRINPNSQTELVETLDTALRAEMATERTQMEAMLKAMRAEVEDTRRAADESCKIARDEVTAVLAAQAAALVPLADVTFSHRPLPCTPVQHGSARKQPWDATGARRLRCTRPPSPHKKEVCCWCACL
jgi:trehalose 6-phosphate synthase/phosphatase